MPVLQTISSKLKDVNKAYNFTYTAQCALSDISDIFRGKKNDGMTERKSL